MTGGPRVSVPKREQSGTRARSASNDDDTRRRGIIDEGQPIMGTKIICFALGALAPLLSVGWLIAYH